MVRYLAYTSPSRENLYPIVATLEALRRHGHEVVVRTLDSELELLRGPDFDAAAIDPAVERRKIDDWRARTPVGALRASLQTFIDRGRYDGLDLLRAIADERPDALLVDVNAWGAMAAAETTGLPSAAWCPYFLPLPSRDTPPFGLGLPPARGPVGRWRDRVLRPALSGVSSALVRARLTLYMTAEPFEYPRSDLPLWRTWCASEEATLPKRARDQFRDRGDKQVSVQTRVVRGTRTRRFANAGQ
jgi:hypothetical protein